MSIRQGLHRTRRPARKISVALPLAGRNGQAVAASRQARWQPKRGAHAATASGGAWQHAASRCRSNWPENSRQRKPMNLMQSDAALLHGGCARRRRGQDFNALAGRCNLAEREAGHEAVLRRGRSRGRERSCTCCESEGAPVRSEAHR